MFVLTKLKGQIHKTGPESSRTPSISRSIGTYFSPFLILINILKILQKAQVAILVYNSSGLTFKLYMFFVYFIVCLNILICATPYAHNTNIQSKIDETIRCWKGLLYFVNKYKNYLVYNLKDVTIQTYF